MLSSRPFALRFALLAAFSLAGASLVVACKPSSDKAAAAPAKKAKKKSLPKDPWLEGLLASAEVHVVKNTGKSVRCKWNKGKKRHLCPNQESWVYVGPQVLSVGGKDEVCVWQHPADDAVVVTKLKGVAKEPLELKHAFAGAAAGVKEAAPVDIVLKVDGEQRAKALRARRSGFESVRIESVKEGGAGNLEIHVSASHSGVGHFCWQLKRLGGDKPAAAPTGEEVAATADAPATEAPAAAPEVKAAAATPPSPAPVAADAKKPAADKAGAQSTKAAPKPVELSDKPATRVKLPKGAELKRIAPVKPLKKAGEGG